MKKNCFLAILNYIIPLMVAAMVSKWTGDRLTNGSIYEEHIRLNGYPYLCGHDELEHTWIAADVMQPSDPDSPLLVLTQDGMTVKDLEALLSLSDVKGFPVVVSQHSLYLVGWVTRRDLRWTLDRERQLDTNIVEDSPVYFVSSADIAPDDSDLPQLNLHSIVDLSPTTVTDQTPMDTVLDYFRKLGLRQILVTHNGRLLGILTKKDVLRHFLRYSRLSLRASTSNHLVLLLNRTYWLLPYRHSLNTPQDDVNQAVTPSPTGLPKKPSR
ncbi:CBS domain protein [Opisthorchis viverrini]|uniref:CBS domain protein n=1 Tax=Opisthorchis viverrini TaxID=6198 RepID=A0A1S8WQL1_OPIVI|nr:CBS domain protein [Opisthorchis viverrini]